MPCTASGGTASSTLTARIAPRASARRSSITRPICPAATE